MFISDNPTSVIKTSRFKFFLRLCPTLFFFPPMNIAAKIAPEIEAVRLFYHDRPVFYGYLRHLTSDRNNGHIYGMLSKIRF